MSKKLTVIIFCLFFSSTVVAQQIYYPPRLSGGCFEEPCRWIATSNELELADEQFGAEFRPEGSFSIIQRKGAEIISLEKYRETEPMTKEALDKHRAFPGYEFREIKKPGLRVWVYDFKE